MSQAYPNGPRPSGGSVHTKTILVVDDDAGIHELLERALLGEGYKVTLAHDGVEGLARVDMHLPNVIVLDLMMPRLDGIGFITELERRGLRGRVPVLVLTANDMGRRQLQGIEAEGYIEKPFSLPQLLEEVARLAG